MKNKFFFFLFLVFCATLLFTGDSFAYTIDEQQKLRDDFKPVHGLVLESPGCEAKDFTTTWLHTMRKRPGLPGSGYKLRDDFFNKFPSWAANANITMISEPFSGSFPGAVKVFVSEYDYRYKLQRSGGLWTMYFHDLSKFSNSSDILDSYNPNASLDISNMYADSNGNNMSFVNSDKGFAYFRLSYFKPSNSNTCILVADSVEPDYNIKKPFISAYDNQKQNLYMLNHGGWRDYSSDWNRVNPTTLQSLISWSPEFFYDVKSTHLDLVYQQNVPNEIVPFTLTYELCRIDESNQCVDSKTFSNRDRFSTFSYNFDSVGRYRVTATPIPDVPYKFPSDLIITPFSRILDIGNGSYLGDSTSDNGVASTPKKSIFSGLLGIFNNLKFLNPFAGFFSLFKTGDDCVDIPIIAGMLNSPSSRYCSWFPVSVRSILTPVLGISGTMLIFGFFVSWLKNSSDSGSIDIGSNFSIGRHR